MSQQGRKFGWKRDLPSVSYLKYKDHPEFKAYCPKPTQIDLTSGMSPIENQQNLGSCVAHATCGALEFLELQAMKQNLICPENFGDNFQSLSRLFVYYNARSLDGDIYNDAGTSLKSAVLGIQTQGICRETLWPYDTTQVFMAPPQSSYDEGLNHKELYSYKLDNTSLNELQQCLSRGYPFIFGIDIYSSFMTDDVAQTGKISLPSPDEQLLGGHALCCVGYDDSQQVFIVRNSWGTHWGMPLNPGYCTMPYSYLMDPNLAADFWTLRKTGPFS